MINRIKVIENIAKLENFREENNEVNFDQNKQLLSSVLSLSVHKNKLL